jgi:hypothetical protein
VVASWANVSAAQKVHVSFIRVSTVGPWARATITIYFGKAADHATDILHNVRGKSINDGAGTSGEECVMPPKDRRNLGFGYYPCGRLTFEESRYACSDDWPLPTPSSAS